ncbi:MAG: hypothetical protein EXX96DRAFT_586459, partial [Benjaminiella poitrasii]
MTPMDINAKIDIRNATVWGVDPGMNDIYFASDGDCKIDATKRRNIHANSNPDAVGILNQMPTPKTVDPINFITSVRYILQNYTIITGYLEHMTLRKRFREICDRLLCGSIKYGSLVENERTPLDPIDHVADYNRPIVIVYENADFRTSMSGTISELLYFMDEYYASQVYPGCSPRTLRKASDHSGEAIHSVLWCTSC